MDSDGAATDANAQEADELRNMSSADMEDQLKAMRDRMTAEKLSSLVWRMVNDLDDPDIAAGLARLEHRKVFNQGQYRAIYNLLIGLKKTKPDMDFNTMWMSGLVVLASQMTPDQLLEGYAYALVTAALGGEVPEMPTMPDKPPEEDKPRRATPTVDLASETFSSEL